MGTASVWEYKAVQCAVLFSRKLLMHYLNDPGYIFAIKTLVFECEKN